MAIRIRKLNATGKSYDTYFAAELVNADGSLHAIVHRYSLARALYDAALVRARLTG